MGPIFHGLGLTRRHHPARERRSSSTRTTATTDERLINLRPGRRAEAYAADITYGTNNEFGFDYLRDNMVTELDRARPARALLRDRRRGRQHPHRRGAHAADHQRPGRGVGGPVLHVRPARAAAQGPSRGRRGGRRLLRRPQGARGLARPKRASRRSSSCSGSRTSTTPTRAWPATSSRRSRPTRSTSATATTSSRTARSSSSTSSPAARCPAGAGSEGLHQAIEAKEGLRVQRETRDPRHDHLPELLPPVRQAGRHDRHGDDRGGGVPQDLQPRRRRRSRPTGRWSARTTPTSSTATRTAKFNALIDEIVEMTEAGRPVLVGTVERREVRDAVRRCSSAAASSTRSSTPSSTRRKRRSSPRPAAPAR